MFLKKKTFTAELTKRPESVLVKNGCDMAAFAPRFITFCGIYGVYGLHSASYEVCCEAKYFQDCKHTRHCKCVSIKILSVIHSSGIKNRENFDRNTFLMSRGLAGNIIIYNFSDAPRSLCTGSQATCPTSERLNLVFSH